MSNPKNISLLALMLLLINLNTNPVNSEMRKSWSRKATSNETEQTSEPLSTRDIMKYFQANAENSDFESVFSDKTDLGDQITTETSDKLVGSETTTEVSSDDLMIVEKSEKEDAEMLNEDSAGHDENIKKNIREGKEDENSSDKRNMTQAERDIIRQGLNLIVLGKSRSGSKIFIPKSCSYF